MQIFHQLVEVEVSLPFFFKLVLSCITVPQWNEVSQPLPSSVPPSSKMHRLLMLLASPLQFREHHQSFRTSGLDQDQDLFRRLDLPVPPRVHCVWRVEVWVIFFVLPVLNISRRTFDHLIPHQTPVLHLPIPIHQWAISSRVLCQLSNRCMIIKDKKIMNFINFKIKKIITYNDHLISLELELNCLGAVIL